MISFKSTTALKLALSLLLLGNYVHAEHDDEFVWKVLETTLPKALSDLTATLSPTTGLVYIAGGCDSELGNQFIEFEDAEGLNQTGFACFSISDKLYSFDPSDETLEELPDLPMKRYRHGAAIAGNFLWLFGGRDVEDGLIAQVDVFDIDAGAWLPSPGDLPEALQTSDNAGFSDGTRVYSAGGFEYNYTAKTTVFRIYPNSTETLQVTEVAPLLEARGDVAATTLAGDDTSFTYVSGGFTHENDFCIPLATVEKFDVATNEWTEAPKLQTPRADKALVTLQNKIYAVGGETQIPNKCNINPNDLPIAGEQTLPVDDVEVLEGGAWKVLASLPNHRFRFAAIGWDPTSTIYSFGGQVAYDNECECFKTTDEIVTYKEEGGHGDETSAASVSNNVVVMMVTGMVGILGAMM